MTSTALLPLALSLSLLLPAQADAAAPAQVQAAISIPADRPVVELELGGARIPFVFDTGSNTALHLTPEVMAKIPGLKLTGRKIKSIDLAGKLRESDEFVVSDFTLNGVRFGEIKGVAYQPWGLDLGQDQGAAPRDVRMSVIGLPLFARQPFIYDYAGKQLRFGAGLDAAEGWKPLAYELTQEGLIATLGNARGTYRLVLDSAANISVVKRSRAETLKDDVGDCPMQLGPGRACKYVQMSLQDSGASVTPMLVDLPDAFTADGIAGSDFFQHYAVYINQAAGRVAVKPATPR